MQNTLLSLHKEISQHFNLEKREIDLVLCHVLNINTAGLFIYDKEITNTQRSLILVYLKQRENGMPLAYLIGFKEFWNLELKVNQHTLIPRPETEQIVELILARTAKDFSGNILDLGTGTGAIALSIAKERPKAQIKAIDFSLECIKVAKYNQSKYLLENVEIFLSHWFQNIDGEFDYILSNPPYIAEDDQHLKDLMHEPITALTAKQYGLENLQHIIINAKPYLKNNGCLILEHGYNQQQDVQKILTRNCYFNVKTHKDLAGIPRITSALFQNVAINS